jgi:transcriptional antiterminator RfaH
MQIDAALNSTQWYAIHTQPKQESRAQENLRAWGLETFCPRVRERHQSPFTGKEIFMAKPLFPRYIFARFQADRLMHRVRFTRGVAKIVGSASGPDRVDENIIRILKSREGADGFIRMGEDLKCGDRVVVREGLFRDFDGIFVRDLLDSERVLILLTTISYQGHIVVGKESVRRVA